MLRKSPAAALCGAKDTPTRKTLPPHRDGSQPPRARTRALADPFRLVGCDVDLDLGKHLASQLYEDFDQHGLLISRHCLVAAGHLIASDTAADGTRSRRRRRPIDDSHLLGVRLAQLSLGTLTNMLITILIVLAIIALIVFIAARVRH